MRLSRSLAGLFVAILLFLPGCATGPSPYERETAVAIWDLEDLSPTETIQSGLGELIAAQVIQTFQEKGKFQVVERERLLLALEELGLGTGALVDESTRLQLGRLVGARLMVFGGYQVIGDVLRLDLRLVEVETGKVLRTSQRTAGSSDLSGWLEAAREAAVELL